MAEQIAADAAPSPQRENEGVACTVDRIAAALYQDFYGIPWAEASPKARQTFVADAQHFVDKAAALGWFLVRDGQAVVGGEVVGIEEVHSAPCSVSYCWGATGADDPQYPLCDGCNRDGTITTTVTTPVDAALYTVSPPSPRDTEEPPTRHVSTAVRPSSPRCSEAPDAR